jgi:hypothetical protein
MEQISIFMQRSLLLVAARKSRLQPGVAVLAIGLQPNSYTLSPDDSERRSKEKRTQQ